MTIRHCAADVALGRQPLIGAGPPDPIAKSNGIDRQETTAALSNSAISALSSRAAIPSAVTPMRLHRRNNRRGLMKASFHPHLRPIFRKRRKGTMPHGNSQT